MTTQEALHFMADGHASAWPQLHALLTDEGWRYHQSTGKACVKALQGPMVSEEERALSMLAANNAACPVLAAELGNENDPTLAARTTG